MSRESARRQGGSRMLPSGITAHQVVLVRHQEVVPVTVLSSSPAIMTAVAPQPRTSRRSCVSSPGR